MTKKELRKIYLKKRTELSREQCLENSMLLASTFFSEYQPGDYKSIHIYLPILRKNEPDTFRIIETIQAKSPATKIMIPVTDHETNKLRNCLLTPETKLEENVWGIPEPLNPLFTDLEPELVIVPLLAFDRKGYRVGYGKGFYDRFLAGLTISPLKVGLSFFPAVEEISDTDQYDIPMNACMLMNEVIKF